MNACDCTGAARPRAANPRPTPAHNCASIQRGGPQDNVAGVRWHSDRARPSAMSADVVLWPAACAAAPAPQWTHAAASEPAPASRGCGCASWGGASSHRFSGDSAIAAQRPAPLRHRQRTGQRAAGQAPRPGGLRDEGVLEHEAAGRRKGGRGSNHAQESHAGEPCPLHLANRRSAGTGRAARSDGHQRAGGHTLCYEKSSRCAGAGCPLCCACWAS